MGMAQRPPQLNPWAYPSTTSTKSLGMAQRPPCKSPTNCRSLRDKHPSMMRVLQRVNNNKGCMPDREYFGGTKIIYDGLMFTAASLLGHGHDPQFYRLSKKSYLKTL